MEKNPFSTREMLSLFLPSWLVWILGPFPDEVGVAPVLIKWVLLAHLLARPALDLIPDSQREKAAAASLAVAFVALVLLVVLRHINFKD